MKHRWLLHVVLLFIMSSMYAQKNEVIVLQLDENGFFPNNPELPVLLYRNVFHYSGPDPASEIEKVFRENNWGGSWRNGIYNFQHYHSTAHEALGVYAGWAEVQLGGPGNEPVTIKKGDLVVLPAGTAHRLINSGGGFSVVGAYPAGQNWDMMYGKEPEFEKAKQNIALVPLPENDPAFGATGKMFEIWK